MKRKSIAIIGAGLGGMAAGIYGQLNGYETHIFEQHTLPGGQCTAWKRKGYTFDVCIHHLFGCAPASPLYGLWEELGAAPREFVPLQECVSVLSPDGKLFRDYYDLERLESHMHELAPVDRRMIRDYVKGIRATAKSDAMGKVMMVDSRLGLVKALPGLLVSWRWMGSNMAWLGRRFSDPFMRRAVPLLIYSNPSLPIIFHFTRHAYGLEGTLKWPSGGAFQFAKSIEKRYTDVGGSMHYRSKVANILTANGKAIGVRLEDGSEQPADVVISNADGRRTIQDMLEGRFTNGRVATECRPANDEMQFAVQVFLGVNRDLSQEPSSMVMLLDEPVTLANRTCHELEMQLYGFDPAMAPAGKGVIKVELFSQYSYWKRLAADSERYAAAKQELADRVIELLEKRYFTGLRQQVEVIDVATLVTWERFTGGTMGLGIYPNRKMNLLAGL
ncbi:MAG: NAD(P)/FAD-dependent oxidoreductase, partial [Dehalococcoidia bacterium]|nr:NAD(P)/FAD-dependent oxidoreductase [Dehalococcoidia bacterium]